MKLGHSLEYLSAHHEPLLAAAKLAGTELDAVIPNAVRLIGYGNTKSGYGPACVVDVLQSEYVCEPHVIWFPWVGAKDKIINFKWIMNLITESHHVMLNIEKKHIAFFEHFAKRGYIRKIGVMEDLPLVEEIHMYQIKRRSV